MPTPTPNEATRRQFLAASLVLAGLVALPRRAQALTNAEASQLINQVVGDINRVINSGRSQAQMYAEFERIFSRYADVPIIARSALGVAARSASPAQMRAFTDAFRGYMARKSGKRFREFTGAELKVQSTSPYKSFFQVKTTAFLPGQSPFDVTFLVSDKSGKDLFFNIFIEGVNMLATERTEIGAMLDKRRGNLDALISDLKTAG